MLTISSLLAILIGTGSSAAPDCRIDFSELPKCTAGWMVSANKPASIVFLPSVSDDNYRKILEGLGSQPTRIAMSPKSWEDLSASYRNDPAKLREIEKHVFVHDPLSSEYPPYNASGYMRDQTVYGFDPATKTIRRTILGAEKDKRFLSEKPTSVCGVPVTTKVDYETRNRFGASPDFGGNIAALPNGTCLSTKGISDATVEAYCGKGTRSLKVDGTYTRVGHIDEIFSLIPDPTQNPPCDFNVLLSSPSKMREALSAAPTEKFFPPGETNALDRAFWFQCPDGERCSKVTDFCKDLQSVAIIRAIEEALPEDPRLSAPEKKGQTSIPRSRSRRTASVSAMTPENMKKRRDTEIVREALLEEEKAKFRELYAIRDRLQKKDCSEFTNSDAVDIMDGKNKFPKFRAWLKENEKFTVTSDVYTGTDKTLTLDLQERLGSLDRISENTVKMEKSQQETWSKIQRELPAQCREKKIELPSLWVRGHSLNPNPTNLQVVGNKIIYPKQFNGAIARTIEKQLGRNFGLIPANTYAKHAGGGNVHCTSNEIRLCRP